MNIQQQLQSTRVECSILKSRLESLIGRLVEMEESLPTPPPFEKGQAARIKGKGTVVCVEGVAEAFGDWIVQVTFKYGASKVYTYPADELEAV